MDSKTIKTTIGVTAAVLFFMCVSAVVMCLPEILNTANTETYTSEFQVVNKDAVVITSVVRGVVVTHTSYKLGVDVDGSEYSINVTRETYDTIAEGEYVLFRVFRKKNSGEVTQLQLYGGETAPESYGTI